MTTHPKPPTSPAGQPLPAQLRPVSKQRPFATVTTVAALILREMSTKYGRNPGGYVWAILEPAVGILFLTMIFSLVLRAPPLGINFAIFYATGLVPFLMFTSVSLSVAQGLNYSKQLLAYPRVTIVDALVARFSLNMLTEMLVGYLIISAILLWAETQTILDLPKIALAVAMVAALAAGIGTLNCFLIMRFPIWQSVWGVLTRPLVLLSGVLFIPDDVPEPFRTYMLWNPLVHPIGQMRDAFYLNYNGDYISPTYVFMVAGITGLIGLLFLRRYHRDILEM